MGTPLRDYSNNLPLMQCSCTVCMISVTLTSPPYLWLQGVYTNLVLWDGHLWNVCDSSCMWLCKCTSCNNFCHVRIVPFSFCIYSSAEINIDFCCSNSGFPSDQIFEYSSYSRHQQNFPFFGDIFIFMDLLFTDSAIIYNSVTRNWTQDTWRESPVLYHWAVTTKQLPALTIRCIIQSCYLGLAQNFFKDGTHTRNWYTLHRSWYLYIARMSPPLTELLYYSTSKD